MTETKQPRQQWWRVEFVEDQAPQLNIYAPAIPMGTMAKVLGQLFAQWIYDRDKELGNPTCAYGLGLMQRAFLDGILDAVYNNEPQSKELRAKYDKPITTN